MNTAAVGTASAAVGFVRVYREYRLGYCAEYSRGSVCRSAVSSGYYGHALDGCRIRSFDSLSGIIGIGYTNRNC